VSFAARKENSGDRCGQQPRRPVTAGPAQAAAPAEAGATLSRDPMIRLEALFDTGTLDVITPDTGTGAIAGVGRIDGTGAVAFASDPRVQGGASGEAGCAAIVAAYEEAMAQACPSSGCGTRAGPGWPRGWPACTRSARCSRR